MKTKHWINFQVIKPTEPQLREDHAMRPQNEGYKRKKINPNEARRQQLIEKAMSALEKPDDDEFDHIGKVIACKLRKMEQNQFIHADKLINDVLYKGLQKQLSSNTVLNDNVYPYSYPGPSTARHFQNPHQYAPFHTYNDISPHNTSDTSGSTIPPDTSTDVPVNYDNVGLLLSSVIDQTNTN